MTTTQDITGVILAGGKGKRLGNKDKGLTQVAGKPLIQYVIDVLAPQVKGIVINANRSRDKYEKFGYPVIADTVGDYWGPLAGVASAMAAIDSPYLLTVPCDSPCLPGNLATTMVEALKKDSAEICVADTGDRIQPAVALYRHGLYDELVAALNRGERKAESWITSRQFVTVDFSDQTEAFLNINTQEDQIAFECFQL